MGYILTILSRFGIMLSMGTGMHLVFSLGGIFFLGMPTVVGATAYALAIGEKAGWDPMLAALIALVISLLMGMLFAMLFLRLSADSFAILGFTSILAFEALTRSWNGVINGVLGLSGLARPEFMNAPWAFSLVSVALGTLLLLSEYLLLQTFWGRAIRAYKENPVALDAMGIFSNRLAQKVIVTSSLMCGVGGILMVWQIQFLEPGFAGLTLLIEALTIGILALKPEIKYVVIGVCFVIALPELLRFLDLPIHLFGYLRVLIYSITLIGLIHVLHPKLSISSRSL